VEVDGFLRKGNSPENDFRSKVVTIIGISMEYSWDIIGILVVSHQYLTAFGVFRRPPWKELSCKPQTALAQAQQVKHGVCA
jgi:hypothetical protein